MCKIVAPYISEMKYMCTINANDMHIRYNIEKNLVGLYFIYEKGKDGALGRLLYIGETLSCVAGRVRNHKKSLRDPDWKTEVTGKKFNEYNISRTQDFDIYFIPYDDELSRYDSRTIEGVFKLLLNPVVFQ